MWFRMPEGVAGISVELQSFSSDVTFEGRDYFRAPDHFAPRILALQGFELVAQPPEGFPDDIPRADPLRDGAIAELTKAAEAHKTEIQNLRSDLNATVAKVAGLVHQKGLVERDLAIAKLRIEQLEEELEAKPILPLNNSQELQAVLEDEDDKEE